jgi:hypothetical protein
MSSKKCECKAAGGANWEETVEGLDYEILAVLDTYAASFQGLSAMEITGFCRHRMGLPFLRVAVVKATLRILDRHDFIRPALIGRWCITGEGS